MNYFDRSGHSSKSVWKDIFGIIVGIGLAAVTIGAIIASGGTLLVPALIGAGVGAAINLGGQVVSNIFNGNGAFDDINWKNVALGGLSGAAFATGIGGIYGATLIGAFSNAGMSAFEGNSIENIVFSFVVGGVAAGIGYGIEKSISNKFLNIDTNLSFSDYLNMARVDEANFWVRNGVAALSKLYTLGPTFTTGMTRGTLKFIGNKLGGMF